MIKDTSSAHKTQGSLDVSLHNNDLFSVFLGNKINMNHKYTLDAKNIYNDSYIYTHIGNPLSHKIHLRAGKLILPFGINFAQSHPSYVRTPIDDLNKNAIGINIITDNQVNFTSEWGLHKELHTCRFTYDTPALRNTRMLWSYAQAHGSRRFFINAGILNYSIADNFFNFEITRELNTSHIWSEFHQIIRIGYDQNQKLKRRWSFFIHDFLHTKRVYHTSYEYKLSYGFKVSAGGTITKHHAEGTYRHHGYLLFGYSL
jgi:hypothetical protein